MKIQWQDVPEADDFGYDPQPEGGVELTHLIAISIKEKPGELSPIARAVISSLAKEIQAMNALLRDAGTTAVMERWTSAGRYELKTIDHAETLGKGLAHNHFLVTSPAEEPGDGTWTREYDWHIEHPSNCTPAHRYDGLCPFEEYIAEAGIDAFGRPADWDDPPFRKRVEYVVEGFPGGPWGPAEYDVYIAEVDEVDGERE